LLDSALHTNVHNRKKQEIQTSWAFGRGGWSWC